MAPKTILSNEDLGKKIKVRRNELRLTIEEAASRAGVGVKTWCRYESGGSIRKDKMCIRDRVSVLRRISVEKAELCAE